MNIKTGNQNKKTKVFTKEEVNTQLTKEDSTRLLELKPRFVGNDASDEHFWNFSKFKIDDSDVSEYFKDYLNSKGFQRIINNQNNWWYKRHPFRKWYSNPDRGTKNWFQIAAQKEPRIIITDNYPEISFTHTYPGNNSVVIVGNRESEEFPFKFTLAHEYTHAKSPRNWFAEPQNFDPKSAQYEVLKQNINTEQNKHDELQYEKHADIWGLKYLLYKEGIYDSRSNKDITEKEVQQLREKYPNLRPLKQMNNKEVVFQLNHVAVNDQNTNRKPLYARKGKKLISKHQTPFQPLDVDERSGHRTEVQQTYEPIPYHDHGTIRDLGGSPSTDTRSSAERNKDYWHPIKGSWERFKTDWNAGRHPIQGLAKTFGTAIIGASVPAVGKALVFNPLGSALGFVGGAAGSKAGEYVDKKLGVDNMFSVAGGFLGGIKPYKYGTNVTKRALELPMRTNAGFATYYDMPLAIRSSKKDALKYILTGNKQSLQNIVQTADDMGTMYQGLNLNDKLTTVPLEQDPISNYLYGTKPGWAKVVDTDDLGVHTEYVRKYYPNKKIRVFETTPKTDQILLEPQNTSRNNAIVLQQDGSFNTTDQAGVPVKFNAAGHLIEYVPEENLYRRQDIWKFNPTDYILKYKDISGRPLMNKYGLGLLNYHGTPFITRTPWIKQTDSGFYE